MEGWKVLERWLAKNQTASFSAEALGRALDIGTWGASALIQEYLGEQRRIGSETLFVLKRTGRTRAAVWTVGQRTADARVLNETLFEDIVVKIARAWKPDMDRLRTLNPQAARFVNAKLDGVVDGALRVLEVALRDNLGDLGD